MIRYIICGLLKVTLSSAEVRRVGDRGQVNFRITEGHSVVCGILKVTLFSIELGRIEVVRALK